MGVYPLTLSLMFSMLPAIGKVIIFEVTNGERDELIVYLFLPNESYSFLTDFALTFSTSVLSSVVLSSSIFSPFKIRSLLFEIYLINVKLYLFSLEISKQVFWRL
jgi:hypothetical protein